MVPLIDIADDKGVGNLSTCHSCSPHQISARDLITIPNDGCLSFVQLSKLWPLDAHCSVELLVL